MKAKTFCANVRCSRRVFLKCGAAACLLMAGCGNSSSPSFIPKTSDAGKALPQSSVVSVRDAGVTTWDGSQMWYGSDSFVRQDRMDEIVRQGVMALTRKSQESAAWTALLPKYKPGKKIAVKPNENNAGAGGNFIDPLPQLLKALIRGLKTSGVAESDIWFLEPSRRIDDRVAEPVKSAYPGVSFYGAADTPFTSPCTYTSKKQGLTIRHADPALGMSRLPDQLGLSTYLIHIPIIKGHGMAGVTLTYKNLFGLFDPSAIPKFHAALFNKTASPFVDIYGSAHVGGKTVLIIGDAIYGAWQYNYAVPKPWKIFGSDLWPRRIFLSRDPVAIDCVMYDFLQWERQNLTLQNETYLIAAAGAGQGTRDHWNNPGEKKYTRIDFIQKDISQK